MKKFVLVLFQVLGLVLNAILIFGLLIVGMDLINRNKENGQKTSDNDERCS